LKKLTHILPQPHLWLVVAVVLYLLSFLFARSFSPSRLVNIETNRLQSYIHEEEKEFNKFVSDTALIMRLAEKQESRSEFKQMGEKRSAFFIFRKSISGNELLFWSTQKTDTPGDILNYKDTAYFDLKENGYYISIKRTFSRPENNDSLAIIGMIPVMYRYFTVLRDKFVL
jgi:hypothetical protein